MKLFCCYTPAHEALYAEVFRPSIPPGYEVRASVIDESGPGDYLSPEFLRCIREKLRLIVRSLDECGDEAVAWSDVDIRFVDLPPQRLLADFDSAGGEIVFQSESPRTRDVNTGFFVSRGTRAVRDFFARLGRELERDPAINEQMAANAVLQGQSVAESLRWGCFPRAYYARTHGWPPPRSLALYHANYTKGSDAIGQKFAQFAELEKILQGGWPSWASSIIRRMPAKIFRGLQGG